MQFAANAHFFSEVIQPAHQHSLLPVSIKCALTHSREGITYWKGDGEGLYASLLGWIHNGSSTCPQTCETVNITISSQQ